MYQFAKFCILLFGILNVVASRQKIVWILEGIPKHDYVRKKMKNCNSKKI
jgi:hypothetical protein